jgi:hypothetical protein
MVNVHGGARLGVLAVGLGIGAAWAHPPVASADTTSTDAASTIDTLLSVAAPAPATPIDLDISFDGYTIYDGGGSAEAETITGQYGLAIAYGDGAFAAAEGGTGDYALASGSDANAEAGSLASGATGNNFDSAVDIGNNFPGDLLDNVGAYAGNGSLQYQGTDVGTDSNDTAYDVGNNSAGEGNAGAFAGYGNFASGNSDTAYDVGNNIASGDGAFAVDGNGNLASDSGNNSGAVDYVLAGEGNGNTAIADTNYSNDLSGVFAYGGNGNYASADGPANSTASAFGGNGNIAYVDDPFGTAGSPDTAFAGSGFSNDLAEVLFTHGNATADSANLVYDIVSLFGNFTGSF